MASSERKEEEPGGEDTVEAKLLFQVPKAELYLVKHPELNRAKHQFKGALKESLAHTPHSDLIAIDEVQMVEYRDEQHGLLLLACVGDVQIPMGAETPVLRMSELLYVVPAPEDPSFSYGVKLPEGSSLRTVRAFERLLERSVDFQVSPNSQERVASQRATADAAYVDPSLLADDDESSLSRGSSGMVVAERAPPRNRVAEERALIARSKAAGTSIQDGAAKAAQQIMSGATWLGSKLRGGAHSLTQHITPAEEPVEVSEATKERASQARAAAAGMVTLSAAAVAGAFAAVDAMASNIANAVKGTEVYRQHRGQAGPRTKAAIEVSRSAVNATMLIMSAMEDAGVHLLQETTDSAVVLARHKYGDDVGEVSANVAAATTDAGRAAVQFGRVGVRSVAKATVKSTARELGNDVQAQPLAIEDGDAAPSAPPPPAAAAHNPNLPQ